MISPSARKLSSIDDFDQLLVYLRDELGWPVESDKFDDVFFSYDPEELGIAPANAAQFAEIKQLRPLVGNQPFGIFFVKFEPKRLPVVALRRILSQLALKKRASSNSAERAAWAIDNILFISACGDSENRETSFAHFSAADDSGHPPTLKVLGWDNSDTPLHLDHVAEVLRERLAWPRDETDLQGWRRTWSSAFTLRNREVVTTSKALAIRLAGLARAIRDRIKSALLVETPDGPVSKLMAAFKDALIHDLSEDTFADMYAQTIAYGLLSARVAQPGKTVEEGVATLVPATTPFLRELMETLSTAQSRNSAGVDFDELGVGDVVELLEAANMEAVLRDFGNRNPQEDPVIHFYERFLREYDPDERAQRGVFYTPRSVVSFIVRTVDLALRNEFGLVDGLADTSTWATVSGRLGIEIPAGVSPEDAFVQILDPATGTGTFIVEAIDLIHDTMLEKWKRAGMAASAVRDAWNEYVTRELLPRVYGYELLMAPYAIAHMKIGLKLHETGYAMASGVRVNVYLTNTLESPVDYTDRLEFAIPALAHEAHAVNEVKAHRSFSVIIGNPPYSNASANLGDRARALVEPYKYVDGEKVVEKNALQLERNLNDDYVKFFAWAEERLKATSAGILSMVSNSVYTWSPSLRGMRSGLISTFDAVKIVDLHGASQRGPALQEGVQDQNVFDIEQPVAIGTFCRTGGASRYEYSEIIGDREAKYARLSTADFESMSPLPICPVAPVYSFLPQRSALAGEYSGFSSLVEICPRYAEGIKTGRDWLVVDADADSLLRRMQNIRDSTESDDLLCDRIQLSVKKAWNLSGARAALREADLASYVQTIAYRPFSEEFIFYHPNWVASRSYPVMRSLIDTDNVALLAGRTSRDRRSKLYWCAAGLADKGMLSSLDNVSVFPALLVAPAREGALFDEEVLRPNLSAVFMETLAKRLGVTCPSGDNEAIRDWTKRVFAYIYAVLWSPSYRERYGDLLASDYPRIPLPKDRDLFEELAAIGSRLTDLHLLRFSPNPSGGVNLLGGDSIAIDGVEHSDGTVWLDRNKSSGIVGIASEVWEFEAGGYRALEKYLLDRREKGGKHAREGRPIADADLFHIQRMVEAIAGTIRASAEIDSAIYKRGSWMDAFSGS